MNKKPTVGVVISALVFFGLPCIVHFFFPNNIGTALLSYGLFGLYPVAAMGLGAWAGFDHDRRWWISFLNPFLFLASMWAFYEGWRDPVNYLHAAIFLGLGIFMEWLSSLICDHYARKSEAVKKAA